MDIEIIDLLIENYNICRFLIGDIDNLKITMDHLTGPQICNMVEKRGYELIQEALIISYNNGFLEDLITEILRKVKVRTDYGLKYTDNKDEGISVAIDYINSFIKPSKTLFRYRNNEITISTGVKSIELARINEMKDTEVRHLLEKCYIYLENKEFDEVITLSRTILENVILRCLDKLDHPEEYGGSLQKMKIDLEERWNTNKDTPKPIKDLLKNVMNGINLIANIRNKYSSAHARGYVKVEIDYPETKFILDSCISICDFLLNSEKYGLITKRTVIEKHD